MSKSKNYSIGEFSEKTSTSIRTLHYYDDIGLLRAEKHPRSGHRIYTDQDVLTLQKVICLKFLGYSLDEIGVLINKSSFDLSLNETLLMQKKTMEEQKENLETALRAIGRIMTLLEDEGEVDSAILMSLINNLQTEKEQRLLLRQHMPKEVVDQLFDKPEEELVALDKEFINLCKKVKRLMGKPVHDPEVQELVFTHIKSSLDFVGEDAMRELGGLEMTKAEELENKFPSPLTKEEEEWLQQAMEYYMTQNDMHDPDAK
ncbi:MerR family transcriptional regulator [Bacillus gobiensis]|uniref:MerR family transcriptional regulator n=1 Tax=Bacillus gobiensis TaxID=1441095 RepID=UPI003D1DC09C